MLRRHRLDFTLILLPLFIALAVQSGMAQEKPATHQPVSKPTAPESQSKQTPIVQSQMQSETDDITSRAVQSANCDFTEAVDCSDPWLLRIPFPHQNYYREKFAPACVRHDLCYRYGYATYGFSRTQCDDTMYQHMQKVCSETSTVANVVTAGGAEAACEAAALSFYRGVQNFSDPYYKRETSRFCPYGGSDENAHVTLINPDGTIGQVVERDMWSSGWSVIQPYTVNSKPYILTLKNISGKAHIVSPRLLEPPDPLSHVLGSAIATYNWSGSDITWAVVNSDYQRFLKGGWSTAEFYTINGKTFLFTLKYENGAAHVNQMDPDGKLGLRIKEYNWSAGWTHVRPFTTSAGNYLFFLKSESGLVHISKLNLDGTVGGQVAKYDWGSGWVPEIWNTGTNVYLFTFKPTTGQAHVSKINPDGTVGQNLFKYDWSSGWTTARFYTVGGVTYLLMLKESNGMASVSRMNHNGSVGQTVRQYDWGEGWTSAVFYQVNDKPYMLFVKGRKGGYNSLP